MKSQPRGLGGHVPALDLAPDPHHPEHHPAGPGEIVRRAHIHRTPYAVYYYVDEKRGDAVVISVWSGMRGEGPPLRIR
mgnify:CR=1 FL=1